MKRISILLASFALIAACSSAEKAEETEQKRTPTSQHDFINRP